MSAKGSLILGLFCLLALAPRAGAQRSPLAARVSSGGSIKVTPAASHLVLGEQDRLALRIKASAELEGLELTTNVGRVDPPRREPSGDYLAVYRPPDRFYPQIALISATARLQGKLVFGWTALRLWGKGNATVKTRPGAEVSVRIGDRSHGPAKADRRGIASVPVVVPPGVRFGWDGRRKVDLNLPAMNHLHLFALPPRVSGVAGEKVSLYLVAVNDDGSPREGPAPRVQAFGRPTKQSSLGGGAWRAEVTVPAGKPTGLEVTAWLPGEQGSRARIELQRQAGGPARIRLDVPTTVGEDPITVRARIVDGLGTPVDGEVRGTSSEGIFEAFVRTGVGEYQALWRPPAEPGESHATLAVSAGGVVSRVKVRFTPRKRKRPLRPYLFWTGVVASGVLLATGIATQVALLNMSSEYKDPGTSVERRQELRDSGEPLVAASWVTLGLGAAAAVLTTIAYFYTDFEGASTTVTASPLEGGGVLMLGSRW